MKHLKPEVIDEVCMRVYVRMWENEKGNVAWNQLSCFWKKRFNVYNIYVDKEKFSLKVWTINKSPTAKEKKTWLTGFIS